MSLFYLVFSIGVGVVAFRLKYLASSALSSSRNRFTHFFWCIICSVLFVCSLPYMLTFFILEQYEFRDKQGSSYNEGWREGFNAAKEKIETEKFLQ